MDRALWRKLFSNARTWRIRTVKCKVSNGVPVACAVDHSLSVKFYLAGRLVGRHAFSQCCQAFFRSYLGNKMSLDPP